MRSAPPGLKWVCEPLDASELWTFSPSEMVALVGKAKALGHYLKQREQLEIAAGAGPPCNLSELGGLRPVPVDAAGGAPSETLRPTAPGLVAGSALGPGQTAPRDGTMDLVGISRALQDLQEVVDEGHRDRSGSRQGYRRRGKDKKQKRKKRRSRERRRRRHKRGSGSSSASRSSGRCGSRSSSSGRSLRPLRWQEKGKSKRVTARQFNRLDTEKPTQPRDAIAFV